LDFLHILPAADQSAAADHGNHHLIAAYVAAIFFTHFLYCHISDLLFLSRTGSYYFAFSATRFARMSAAVLPFNDLDKVIPEQQVDLAPEGHWC
jgi:hypothetical protein